MTRLLPLLFWTFVLAGCATKHWAKPGATAQDFRRDSWECAQQTATVERKVGVNRYAGVYDERHTVSKDRYRACLEALGYERTEGGEFVGLRD